MASVSEQNVLFHSFGRARSPGNGWDNQVWHWDGAYLSTGASFCLSVYVGGGA